MKIIAHALYTFLLSDADIYRMQECKAKMNAVILEDDAKKKKKGRVGDMKSNTVKIETIVKMAIWASYSCECCIIKLIDLILKLLHISTVF